MKVMLALALVAMPVLGCGGSSATGEGPHRDPLADYPSGSTRQFIIPGRDNTIQIFGHEATKSERAQATSIVQAWLRAREAEDWAADCHHMARATARELAKEAATVSRGKASTCPAALEFFGADASGSDLTYNMVGPVASLRVERSRGYAQYHGPHGIDWIVPVYREGDRWTVAIAAPIDRRK